jgi:hypothetical protein
MVSCAALKPSKYPRGGNKNLPRWTLSSHSGPSSSSLQALAEKGLSQTGDIVWANSNMSVLVFRPDDFLGDLFIVSCQGHGG